MAALSVPFGRLFKDRRMAPILAVTDQSLYALSNLIIQIIVARSVSPEEFGAYSVGTTFFVVAVTIHQACIIEPMFVFSTQRYAVSMAAYHKRLRRGWSVIFGATVLVIGVGIAATLWSLGSPLLAKCVAAFAVVSPFALYMWLLRRMAFALGRFELAVLAGAIYSSTLLGMAGAFWYAGHLSAVLGICLTGVAAGLASISIGLLFPRSPVSTPPPHDMMRQHLRYGRWAVGSEAVNWLINNGPILALPIWFGLSAAAQLRVVYLFFMPLLQIVAALTVLLLRHFTSLPPSTGYRATAMKYVWLLFAGAALYSANAIAFGVALAPKIFGPQYIVEVPWMILGGAFVSLSVMTQGFFTALRAREQSNRVLITYLVILGVMAAMLPLVAKLGVTGILAAQTIAWGFALPLAGVLVFRVSTPSLPLAPGANRSVAVDSESAAKPSRT
jgi:O-antigen/teichoic acid export membrane protein